MTLPDPFTEPPTALPRAPTWPEPIAASTLCAAPPVAPPVLIEGILYSGGTMMISGPSKAHKTFTLLDVALAVAEGRPWLGHKTAQAPVLYLNLELQDFAVEMRIRQICAATRTRVPATLHLWNLRGKRVSLTELRARLPDQIAQLGARLVVIDPHYKVSAVSGMEENSNDSQGELLTSMEELCATGGAALAVCHHFAKGDASGKNAIDRASGGGVMARWGDVVMTFTPHKEDEAMSVEMALRNFAPVAPFAVRWAHPRWERDATLDPAQLKKAGRTMEHPPADLLEALGGHLLTNAEWRGKVGWSEPTYRRRRDELLKAGKVTQVGGLYRKAEAA